MSNHQIDIIVQEIYEWNKERGLTIQGYCKRRESAFITEELNELLRAKDKVEIVDSHIDSIIYQVGAIFKAIKVKEPFNVCKLFECNMRANIHYANTTYSDSIIEWIYKWNKARDTLKQPYSLELEATFIVNHLQELLLAQDDTNLIIEAHIDSVISQMSALSKLIQDPSKMQSCFDVVLRANKQKGKGQDNNEKFIDPSKEIKKILNDTY